MSHDLPQRFEQLIRGALSPEVFGQELLTLCKERPECAWESLALLDQYFRRGKISAEVQQTLRSLLGRQALRTVGGRPAASPARATALRALPSRSSRRFASARLASPKRAAKSRTLLRAVPMRAAPLPVASPPPLSHLPSAAPLPPALPPAWSDIVDDEPTIETLVPAEPAPVAADAAPPAVAADLAPVNAPADDPVPSKDAGRVWPAALIGGHTAKAATESKTRERPERWRRYFRTAPVIALAAVVLAVAATPTVRETSAAPPAAADASGAGVGAHADAAPAQDGPAATPAPPADTVSFSSERYVIEPNRAVAEISVERSADASGDTSFLWWTEPSGAKPDEDYVGGAPRRAVIADGTSSAKLRIPLIANPARHHIQMFYVVIGRPSGETELGPIHRAAVFILPPHLP